MENIPFDPLFARVLLKREKTEKVGSLYIPETAQSRLAPDKGILLAVGHTCEEILQGYIGKTVMFAKHSGAWIKIKEDEYFICQEEDLLGAVHE